MSDCKAAQTVVFTDLDGTLLDHDTYDWTPALPALQRLRDLGIPIIFVTSKTKPEVEQLREKIGNDHPFIVENGGAIIVPDGYFNAPSKVHMLGRSYQEILNFLQDQRQKGMLFKGFFDMSAQEIVESTGLDLQEAEQAAQRSASEPLVWQDGEEKKKHFIAEAQANGFQALQGGRFLTVGGKTDKGKAAHFLIDLFKKAGQEKTKVIALGDSGNDVAFLKIATHPIWVRKKGDTPTTPLMENARCTLSYGPSGWNDALQALLLSN